jgi:hypothetical protein
MPTQHHVENAIASGVVDVGRNGWEGAKESPDRDFSSGLFYWELDVDSFKMRLSLRSQIEPKYGYLREALACLQVR